MKKICPSLFILLLLFSFSDCKKEPAVKPNYFVFGRYYGFCGGEQCIEIYKIENKVLYEDLNDHYPSSDKPYEGKFTRLGDSKYQFVKDLQSKMPAQLFSEKQTIIGSPDAGDWGGIYIEVRQNNIQRFWLIDNMNINLPDYLQSFGRAVSEAVDAIQ